MIMAELTASNKRRYQTKFSRLFQVIAEADRKNNQVAREFFREEYILNNEIGDYSSPTMVTFNDLYFIF